MYTVLFRLIKSCKISLMNKRIIWILVIAIAYCSTGYSQGKKKELTKVPVVSSEERAASVTFANGLKAFYSQNYAGAEKEFLSVVSTRPSHAPSYYMLGKLKAEQRDYATAEYYLNKAAAADKKNIWYLVELAQVLDEQGNYEKSVKIWDKICAAEPRSEYYLFYYSDACLHLGKYKEVIGLYDRMEKLMGYNEELTAAKVELWLHLDDVKNAVGEYDKLIKVEPWNENHYIQAAGIYITNRMADKAVPYFEKVLQLNPDNAEVQLVMADYYDQRGDKQAAYNAWLAAFRSKDISAERKLPVLRRFLTALPTSNPTPEQYALAQALTEANPDAVEGWAALGSLKMKERKYADAAVNFEHALSIDLSQYAIWQDYLYCLAQAHDYGKVLEKEADVLELFPTSSMMYYTLGVAHLNTGNARKSLTCFEKALEYTYDNAEKSRIYNMMANAYHELGDTANEEQYRKKGNR